VVVWGEQLGHTGQDDSHEVGDRHMQEKQYDVGVYMRRPQSHGVYYIWGCSGSIAGDPPSKQFYYGPRV
jgi:hypothetical protein